MVGKGINTHFVILGGQRAVNGWGLTKPAKIAAAKDLKNG